MIPFAARVRAAHQRLQWNRFVAAAHSEGCSQRAKGLALGVLELIAIGRALMQSLRLQALMLRALPSFCLNRVAAARLNSDYSLLLSKLDQRAEPWQEEVFQ